MKLLSAITILVLVAVVSVVFLFKPQQESISALQASTASTDDEQYLGMINQNMVSGGPPKDGIPAIDEPAYLSADNAGLEPSDEVFGVVVGGQALAYPQKIMYWHEVVNDEINGKKFSLTYCPLTGTVIGYWNENLGVSGKLYNNNLVLYDRRTNSEIPQMLGTAVNGPRKGQEFERFPTTVTTWEQWKKKHPDTLVLSRNTGFDRDYDRNPYPGYDYVLRLWFPVGAKSDRFPTKKWMTGIEHNNEFLAVPKKEFKQQGKATVVLGGEKIIIEYDDGLDTITAQTINGEEVLAFDTYWFAWYAYHPNTKVFSPKTS